MNGILNVNAFQGTPGPIHVTADDVRSFTIDGKPLPPLIRVTDAGNSVFGTSDAALSVIRVARLNAQGQPNFDLSLPPQLLSHGPIVFRTTRRRGWTSRRAQTSVPLVDLKTSSTGAVFATDEAVEHVDLNGPIGVGDGDETDQVVQIVETATGITTNPRMAASPLKNPIVGTAAIAIGGNLAAFIQGEANENAGGAIERHRPERQRADDRRHPAGLHAAGRPAHRTPRASRASSRRSTATRSPSTGRSSTTAPLERGPSTATPGWISGSIP